MAPVVIRGAAGGQRAVIPAQVEGSQRANINRRGLKLAVKKLLKTSV
jgi:hypothetical protein